MEGKKKKSVTAILSNNGKARKGRIVCLIFKMVEIGKLWEKPEDLFQHAKKMTDN